jgi:hypothetical protein
MELFEQYTSDESIIDWKTMFEGLQDYRKKAIEQSIRKKNRNFCNKNSSLDQYEQLLWTEIYRPKTTQTYLGNHTKQIKRLNEWLFYWTKKLRNEQPKKVLQKKRKRFADYDDEDFTDNSSKYLEKKKTHLFG